MEPWHYQLNALIISWLNYKTKVYCAPLEGTSSKF
jgi:hypothetical protein